MTVSLVRIANDQLCVFLSQLHHKVNEIVYTRRVDVQKIVDVHFQYAQATCHVLLHPAPKIEPFSKDPAGEAYAHDAFLFIKARRRNIEIMRCGPLLKKRVRRIEGKFVLSRKYLNQTLCFTIIEDDGVDNGTSCIKFRINHPFEVVFCYEGMRIG